MIRGEKRNVQVELVKIKTIGHRKLRTPTKIKAFGLEYALSQPINLENYTLKKEGGKVMVKEQEIKSPKEIEKIIESHLRKVKSYESAVKNLKAELEYLLPGITAKYEYKEGTAGNFTISSKDREGVLDRVNSAKAINLNEQLKKHEIVLEAIKTSLAALDNEQVEFIHSRYYEEKTYENIAQKLNCSQSYIYKVRKDVLESLRISLYDVLE